MACAGGMRSLKARKPPAAKRPEAYAGRERTAGAHCLRDSNVTPALPPPRDDTGDARLAGLLARDYGLLGIPFPRSDRITVGSARSLSLSLTAAGPPRYMEIGRASCRERV